MRIARRAWPATVMKPRWPRALTRSTQKPFAVLGKVTRSTRSRQDSVELAVDIRAMPR